jgi:hypothetical protein
MTRKGARIGHRWFTEAVGKWPKSNCLTIIKRPAGTHIPIQLLVRDHNPRQAVSERNLEVSEFGLRDA